MIKKVNSSQYGVLAIEIEAGQGIAKSNYYF